MPISNNITRSVRPGSIFESAIDVVDESLSFNQGDLLIFDTGTGLIALPASEGDGATFLGVAIETIVDGKLKRPYVTDVDASQAISDVPGPLYGVIAKLQLKPGDTLNPGSAVYLSPATSTRGVQASGTKSIGVYQGQTVTGGPSDSLTEVEILVGHRYPGDALAF